MNHISNEQIFEISSWWPLANAQAAARGEPWTLPWWPAAMASTLRGTVAELQQLMKVPGPWKLGDFLGGKKQRIFLGVEWS